MTIDSQLPPEIESHLNDFYQSAYSESEEELILETQPSLSESQYSVKELYAVGGMKAVSTVVDAKTDRTIAFAELKEDQESKENIGRFLREARITAALEHPNIVPVYDVGIKDDGLPYFTMKFLQGETLKKVLRELLKANPTYVNKYPLNSLLEIFMKICEAVSFSHSCGVLHLDIKPENIMIGKYGEVYLCDWGIARVMTDHENLSTGVATLDADVLNDITLSGMVKGTPGFMAPEQVDKEFGKKDVQTDIYALGALLYNILSLRKPFSGKSAAQILELTISSETFSKKFMSKWDIPEALKAICFKAANSQKSQRYGSVEDLISDMRSYQSGFVTKAEDTSFVKEFMLYFKRHKFLGLGIIVGLLSIMLMLTIISYVKEGSSARERVVVEESEKSVEKLKTAAKARFAQYKRSIDELNNSLRQEKLRVAELKVKYEPVTISINFTDGGYGFYSSQNNKAGVLARGHWLTHAGRWKKGTEKVEYLKNSDGVETEVSFDIQGDAEIGGASTSLYLGHNNKKARFNNVMMENWTDFFGVAGIKFSGLSSFASEYDVIVYSWRPDKTYKNKISIGDKTFFVGVKEKPASSFIKSSAKSLEELESYEKSTNYVIFESLNDDSFELKIEKISDKWAAISGIQIIQRQLPVAVSSEQ